jgi:hypothetical protein
MIYLTYEDAAGHAIALNVRNTAALYGVTVFVPPLQSRDVESEDFRELGRWISGCDSFMAVITLTDPPPALKWEIERTKFRDLVLVGLEFNLDDYARDDDAPAALDGIACLIVGQLALAAARAAGGTP